MLPPRRMNIRKNIAAVLTICALMETSLALENGLARTPPMGWNSWATYELNINEELIRSMADALASSGMKEAGYEYVIVDAGWKAKSRDPKGNLQPDAKKFPSGMKALADYIHSRGLKFGIYTDAGFMDCVSDQPGSKGFEEKDARTFAEWDVDFVKEDWCNTQGMDAKEAYSKMSHAIAAVGRPMLFSMCEWGDHKPWEWAADVANLWRTTGDSKDCWDCGRETMNKPGGYPRGWTLILDAQRFLAQYAAPGHWNDPDMLQVGHPGLSAAESRAHFSLWAILAAPLIATNDVRSMSRETREILTNPEVIAVDQDAAGREGTLVRKNGDAETWVRSLSNGDQAVVFFNRNKTAAVIHLRWTDLGKKETDALELRDLWTHKDLAPAKRGYSARVSGHGVVMFRVTVPRSAPTQ